MELDVLDLLRCPSCRSALREQDPERLACTGCTVTYPVVNAIPRFVPADNYASNFGLQWNEFRQTQLDSFTGVPVSRNRFMNETGWTEADLRGKRVLDAGCGAGRFAEIALSLGAELFAIDYSSAADACKANLGANPRLHVFQADIYALPFAEESFDFVYSLGVLHCTPDVRRATLSLVPFLKRGGRIAVDFYLDNLARFAHPKFWLRPITTRMRTDRLFRLTRRAAPSLLRLSRALKRVPLVGTYLARAVPVANYDGVLPLNAEQLREWAILDTFDWLAPRFDQPQTAATLRQWLDSAGLERVEVFRSHHLTGRGVRT